MRPPLLNSICAHLSLLLLSLLISPTNADLPAYSTQHLDDYDHGKWGFFPSQQFRSNNFKAPRILRKTWNKQCNSNTDYFFIAPRGPVVSPENAGPVILDSNGNLVWRHSAFPSTYNLKVQHYKGQQYLTFWSGNDAVKGHGNGFYYMLDQEYRLVRTVGAVNGLHGDLHEFTITPQGTALCTVFAPTEYDLSAFNVTKDKHGKTWIWDAVVQEIDMETNELLFEWRGSHHLNVRDSFKHPRGSQGRAEGTPWDFFHINSVDKDAQGNYLISGRYFGLVYLSGQDGKVIWYLGGKNNNFTDLSYGTATNMHWQHHARWQDDHTTITLFDNNAQWGGGATNKPSRGMKIRLDEKAMSAKIVFDIIHPDGLIADAQGSLQTLPNGNLFLGYGSVAAFTEFTPTGDVVCDAQFGALHAGNNHAWTGGAVMSYRAYKMPWVATPHYNPWVAFDKKKSRMFVSWNGATEVKRWLVEGSTSSNPSETQWKFISKARKNGFETGLKVPAGGWDVLRLTAVDKEASAIRCWTVFPGPLLKQVECPGASTVRANLGGTHISLIGAILLFPILFLVWRYWNRITTIVGLPNREQILNVREKAHVLVDRIGQVRKRFSNDNDDGRDHFLMDDRDEDISDDETTKIDSLSDRYNKHG